MTHLLLTDLIRKNGNKIPQKTPQFLFSGTQDYPSFFHKILSYFPKAQVENSEYRISPFIDGLHASCIFLASGYLLVLLGFVQLPILVIVPFLITIGWLALPIYVSNPALRSIISERPFGVFFGHGYLLWVVMYLITNHYIFIGLAFICFLILAASSKFAFQAVIFISTILAVISLKIEPVMIIIFSLLLSIVLTRGYVFRVLKGTIRHSLFYKNFLVKRHGYTASFRHETIIQAGKLLITGKFSLTKKTIESHPLYKMWFFFPWLIPFILDAIMGEEHSNEIRTYLQYWVWSGLIITILTTTDWFKFLGEAERYLEYVALPMIFLGLTSTSEAVQISIIFPLIVSLYHFTKPHRVFSSASNETIHLLRWLEKQPASIILALPNRISFSIAYSTEHKFLSIFINIATGRLKDEWKELLEGNVHYPYYEPSKLKNAYQKYKADFLIVDKKGLDFLSNYQDVHYEIDENAVIYSNQRYVVMDAEKYSKSS